MEIAWHTVAARNAEIYPLMMLASVLSEGVTSRLYQSLVEKELAVSVTASADRLYDQGLFEVTTTIRPQVKPELI